MQDRHKNRERYFNEQARTTEKYVIPYIESEHILDENTTVLEIGCGEGGNLKPFVDRGCKCVGVDMAKNKIENGKAFFTEHPNKDNLTFIADDVFNLGDEHGKFDVIFMRDVLEHIHNQEKFMKDVKKFLKPTSKFFLGFPPWCNPFGGHQQVCKSKFLSKLPYFHILPKFMYRGILKIFGESKETIEVLMEIKDTRISIERFKRIVKKEGYTINQERFYFINPNYETKFNLKARLHWKWLSAIPFTRNFTITTCYYIISHDGER